MQEISDLKDFVQRTGLQHVTVARWLDISIAQLYKYYAGDCCPPKKRLKKIAEICNFLEKNQLIIPETHLPIP